MKINVSFDIEDLEGYWGEDEINLLIANTIKEDLIKELKKSKEYKEHIKLLRDKTLRGLVQNNE